MNQEVRSIMEQFFAMLYKANIACMSLISGNNGEGVISVIGNGGTIRSSLKNCFDHVRQGDANEGQEAIVDIILDVISLSYSPHDLFQIMDERTNILLRHGKVADA